MMHGEALDILLKEDEVLTGGEIMKKEKELTKKFIETINKLAELY